MSELRAQVSRLELEYGVFLKALVSLENRLKIFQTGSRQAYATGRTNKRHFLRVSSVSTRRPLRSGSNAIRVRFRRIQNQIGSLEDQKNTLNGIIGNLEGKIRSFEQVLIRNDSTLEKKKKREAFFLRILGRMNKKDPNRRQVQEDLVNVRGRMKLLQSQTASVRRELRGLIEVRNAAEETFEDIKKEIRKLEAEADRFNRTI